MLQEIDKDKQEETETVTLSASAIDAVRKIFAEKKLEGYALRVYVAGGGCSGVNFGMALDNNFRENDLTFMNDDVKVVIDNQSMAYLYGAKIDYVNDPERGGGFVINSPANLGGGCSCGSKSESGDESSCGSGDGCGSGGCGCS